MVRDDKALEIGAEIALTGAPIPGPPAFVSQLVLIRPRTICGGSPHATQKHTDSLTERYPTSYRTLTIVRLTMAPVALAAPTDGATNTACASGPQPGKVKQTRRRQRLSCVECTRRRQVRDSYMLNAIASPLTPSPSPSGIPEMRPADPMQPLCLPRDPPALQVGTPRRPPGPPASAGGCPGRRGGLRLPPKHHRRPLRPDCGPRADHPPTKRPRAGRSEYSSQWHMC